MNELIYIKFNDPKTASSNSDSNESKVHKFVAYILEKIIPKTNPNFDDLIDQVNYWKIEYNTEKHWTNREMGFDSSGKLIVAMPLAENYGFWSDLQMELEDFNKFDIKEIEPKEFIKEWNEFEYKFNLSQQQA